MAENSLDSVSAIGDSPIIAPSLRSGATADSTLPSLVVCFISEGIPTSSNNAAAVAIAIKVVRHAFVFCAVAGVGELMPVIFSRREISSVWLGSLVYMTCN